MDKAKYMVFLRKPIDENLRTLLKSYILESSGLEYILCSEWEQNGVFVYLKAADYQANQQWGINIPLNAVLSVADFNEARNIGFTTKLNRKPL
ncbi:MAG: hypothetical protein ACJA2E_001498 [Arenicella sp.]|jgi:hypothetical protein